MYFISCANYLVQWTVFEKFGKVQFKLHESQGYNGLVKTKIKITQQFLVQTHPVTNLSKIQSMVSEMKYAGRQNPSNMC